MPLNKRLLVQSGVAKLTFHSDNATVSTGFNASFMSNPTFEFVSKLVPGQDDVSFGLILLDRFQSKVNVYQDLRYIKVLICHLNNSGCSDSDSYIPALFIRASEDSLFRVPSSFFKCIVGESVVVVHFSVADLYAVV